MIRCLEQKIRCRLNRRRMLASSAAILSVASPAGFARDQTDSSIRRVAVTIDDGPAVGARRDLGAFLRIATKLRESFVAGGVPAIMFVNEQQLHVDGQRDERVAVLHRWLDAGLELGNHTYSHTRLESSSVAEFQDDIVKGEVITRPLLEARGQQLVWFRYPFLASGEGETAAEIESFLDQRDYKIAPVSVDYHDYRFNRNYMRLIRAGERSAAETQLESMLTALDQAFQRAETRSREILGYELPQILLIHCNEMNSLTLPKTLRRIQDRGYRFVSLADAMADPAYRLAKLPPGDLGGGGFFDSLETAKRAIAP